MALSSDGRAFAACAMGQIIPANVNRNHAADARPVTLFNELGGTSYGGAAYVFTQDGTETWTQTTSVFPPVDSPSHAYIFDWFAMAFAADTRVLALAGTAESGIAGSWVYARVFVY